MKTVGVSRLFSIMRELVDDVRTEIWELERYFDIPKLER